MIYDTLFALDEKLAVKPQMVDKYETSRRQADLDLHAARRPGMARRQAGDRGGLRRLDQALGRARRDGPEADGLRGGAQGASTPRPSSMVLKEPYGLVLETLGKPVVQRALHDAQARRRDRSQQADRPTYIGSGPFIFKKDEWKPGEKAVYVKNPKYKPRAEPASGLAGGKVVKVDRVEMDLRSPDPQTQVNALHQRRDRPDRGAAARPAAAARRRTRTSSCSCCNPLGRQYAFRFNALHKPFDNPKIRQAVALRAQPEGLPRGR